VRISILAPDLSGGGMTRAYWIAQLAQSLGHEVEVAGPLIREASVYPEPPPGLCVTRLAGESVSELAARWASPRSADLLYAIKPLRTSFGVALEARRARRRPLVLDIDDWEPEMLGSALRKPGEAGRRALANPRRALRGLLWRAQKVFGREQRFGGRHLLGLRREADVLTVNNRALVARYGGTLLPSFPRWVLDGTQPTRAAWLLKEKLLPPVYWKGMLKGHEWMVKPEKVSAA